MKDRMYRFGVAAMAALCLGAFVPKSAVAQMDINISVGTPPPPLLVYEQPAPPGVDYIWAPGYWAWGSTGYFWVPGAWVLAPEPGLLWTPGYWVYEGSAYRWHRGYWARRVGYYGGINYGFGYFGTDYVGGRWNGRHFFYNTAVTRVNTTVVRNVYVDKTVIVNRNVVNRAQPRVSYNGGAGGIVVRPRAHEVVVRERRPMTEAQVRRERDSEQRGQRGDRSRAPSNGRRDRQ